jgi:hypothetical protein
MLGWVKSGFVRLGYIMFRYVQIMFTHDPAQYIYIFLIFFLVCPIWLPLFFVIFVYVITCIAYIHPVFGVGF